MGTVAALIFAILLSLADLDAKRLEPWFELSKPEGATAKDSVLLCYPFDFLAFVPFTAAKRGHWSVFHIGTATVLVFWFITPLQSSLIATVQQQMVIPGNFITTRVLNVLSNPGPETNSFTNTAYSISWLNSTPPLFSTKMEAVLPFQPVSDTLGSSMDTEKWTANTTAYYADLSCNEAERRTERIPNRFGKSEPDQVSYFYDRETNCTFKHDGFPTFLNSGKNETWKPYYGIFVGYHPGSYSNYYLKTSTCDAGPNPQMFLIIFARKWDINDTATVNAVYCKVKYKASAAQVVVDARTKLASNVTYLGSPREMDYSEFNATIFETMVSGGGPESAVYNGGPFGVAPMHSAKARNVTAVMANTDWDVESNVLGFMFAIDSDIRKYLDANFVASTIGKAYKLLFTTYAATQLMVPQAKSIDGRILYTTETVVVEETFTRILEGLLGAVLLLLISFLISSTRRRTGLIYDPASLAGTMALVANGPDLLEKFGSLDGTSTINELHQAVADESLRYKLQSKGGRYQLSILPGSPNPTQSNSRTQMPLKNEQERNVELGAAAGSIFIIFLAVLLIFLIYIFHYGNSNNGLPSFDNVFVSQLLFSYIPTALGMFLEPFWVLLTRFICVLQPLETLRRGHALASESLTLKFESKPPSLTIFAALKSKHFFLAILAVTALSTNALAIAFGALFNPTSVPATSSLPVMNRYQPSFRALPYSFNFINAESGYQPQPGQSSYLLESQIPPNHFAVGRDDHYYALYANYTLNTSLPEWTTPSHFFLPINIAANQIFNSSDLAQAETLGLNASLVCEPLEVPISLGLNDYLNTTNVRLNVEANAYENAGPGCVFSTNFIVRQVQAESSEDVGVPLAMEAYPNLLSISNTTQENDICGSLVPAIFSKTKAVDRYKPKDKFDLSSFKYKSIVCRPNLTVNRYQITFDSSRQIVNAEVKNTSADEKALLFAGNITEGQFLRSIRQMFQPDLPWEESFKQDNWLYFSKLALPTEWIDLMIQKVSNSTSQFDPATPIEDVDMTFIGQQLSEAYSQVFAIILGLYHERMFTTNTDTLQQLEGTRIASVTRVQMSPSMFALAAGLLGWYLLLAIHFYLFRVSRFFQRLPTSLASEIQLFHKSAALDDVRGTELLTSGQRDTHLKTLKRTYGYGRFLDREGTLRVGIEREPLLDHMSDKEVRNQGLGRIGLTIQYWTQWVAKLIR
ncbi:hypothetical protein H072_6401 [Dactylellina haptotyla CBS 200.50]|uniref:Uncharacterized protein n=1 Tax=Dactylellina haptotyla (strain CBS 200.50) TaxID=1284197 RepID=S8BKF8_DACHA|nr:hypothetical protein H072_6401 [Dactylellina haptotyla CBS 200.50]